MIKNEEKEGKSSKGQRKDEKLSKINKSRVNDNKLPPANEKEGKPDDVSNKFPNFCRLTAEERVVFFKALNAARRNVEERGVPMRERFGTVHDEYLQHFEQDGESEDESTTEKSSSSFLNLSVSSFSQPSTCSFGSDNFEELPSSIGENSPEPSLPDQYEAIIRQDADSIIDLFLEKKSRNASKWSVGLKEKRKKAEQEKKVEESAWAFLMSGTTPKTTDTPRFDALNDEEKTVFFRILEEARNKVLEKNPEKKKEILPMNSIVKMYQGHRLASRIYIPQEKSKSLKVKVTLTSGDNQRMQKNYKEKLEVLEPAPEVEKMIKEAPLEDFQREGLIKTEMQQEGQLEKKEVTPSEPISNISMNSITECSDSVESIDTKLSIAESKPEETSLKKSTSMQVSTTENTEKTMEEKKLENSLPKDEQLEEMHKKNVQLEENPKNEVADVVKSVTKSESEINPKEKPEQARKEALKQAVERETSGASFFSLDREGNSVMEIQERKEKKKGTPEDGKHPSETTRRKVKLEDNSGKWREKEKLIGLSLHEEELISEKDQVAAQEKECNDKDLIQEREEGDPMQLQMEEECTKKEMETPEEKEEISGEECEDGNETETEESEMELKEEATVEKCESQWEGEMEEKDEEVARKICESLVALPRTEESDDEREPKEETKIEEEATEGFLCPEPWDHATTSAKVMIVEDNVIEKIRKLIYYLEGKAKKDGQLEKEYLKLLVDYVDYLSKILQILVDKKEHQIQLQNTYTAAEARLKFDDTAGTTADIRMPGKFVPRSVSAQALGADALLAFSQENVRGDSKKNDDATFASDSDISLDQEEDVEDVHFLPPTIGSKKVISTKIRLLQDLLKRRAEFAEGSTNDFKIVHHPEEEFVPVEKPPTVRLIKEDNEESAQQDHKFFKLLVKCCTCGKKKDEEDGIYENLKGEVVRVDVSEKKKDPANATLNQSTMEVLKAAGRKKIIEKYYIGE